MTVRTESVYPKVEFTWEMVQISNILRTSSLDRHMYVVHNILAFTKTPPLSQASLRSLSADLW